MVISETVVNICCMGVI